MPRVYDRLVPKLPRSIIAALASDQATFALSEPSTDAHCVFVTAVVGSPVQISGRLSKSGEWSIRTLLTPPAAERESDARAALNELEADGILILRTEPVAIAMVRFAIAEILSGRFAPGAQGLEAFKCRLAASRFALAAAH